MGELELCCSPSSSVLGRKSGFEKTGERRLLMRCLIRSSEGFAFLFILNT